MTGVRGESRSAGDDWTLMRWAGGSGRGADAGDGSPDEDSAENTWAA